MPSYRFDGHGINDAAAPCDYAYPYASRIATFTHPYREGANLHAALWCAAPDMLAALKMICEPSPHYAATQAHRDRVAEARKLALAAIAKAEGRTP